MIIIIIEGSGWTRYSINSVLGVLISLKNFKFRGL